MSSTSERSPPAENALPAPVTTTTRVFGSASTTGQICVNSVQARVGRVQHLRPVDGDDEHPVRLGLEREVAEVGVVHDVAPQASSGPTPPPVHENECAVSVAGSGAPGASTAVRT